MAKRAIKGTLIRNSWEFYESGAAWSYQIVGAPAGPIYALLDNNSAGAAQLDIYKVEFASSIAARWDVAVVQNITATTSVPPGAGGAFCIQPDRAAPPGAIAFASSITGGPFLHILTRSDVPQHGVVDMMTGGPFVTLPPTWTLVVSTNLSAPAEVSVTVWYQQILDMHEPAP